MGRWKGRLGGSMDNRQFQGLWQGAVAAERDWGLGSHGAGGMGEKGGKGEGTYPAGGLMDGGQQQLVSVVRFLGMVKKKVRGRESEQKCL